MKLFDNTRLAYQLKSDKELKRAYWLFRLVGFKPLVKLGSQVIHLLVGLGFPVAFLFRKNVFRQFCSGISQADSFPVLKQLSNFKVFAYLHFAVEGEEQESEFDKNLHKTLESFDFAISQTVLPFVVFKPTGFGKFELFEKVSRGATLDKAEALAWERVKNRFERCAKKAQTTGIRLLIDAEESWVQPAIDQLAETLMERFNTEKAFVHTTIQMYRHDRLEYLKTLTAKAKANAFKIGVKLVRGAYIEKENKRAEALNSPSPLCATKAETDLNFDRALDFCLDEIETVSLFIGSHNETSLYKALEKVAAMQLPNDHPHLWFSQLYGMSDHITFNLAHAGFQSVKYVPYGPVKEVIPYLIRRAEENTSVAGQTGRELDLIIREQKRRKTKRNSGRFKFN